MTDNELIQFLKDKYSIQFPIAYIHFANNFSRMDSKLNNLQTHHICPRCCGGDDDENNLIKITFHHHRKLHQLILQTVELTDEQKSKLTFAYKKMLKG